MAIRAETRARALALQLLYAWDQLPEHALDPAPVWARVLPLVHASPAVRDRALLYYTGLLSLMPRSASALEHLLGDYFQAPAEVEQFVGTWQPLDAGSQCRFENGDSFSEQLSVGAVAGDAIWDQQSRVRIQFGPLALEQYEDFLPGGRKRQRARDCWSRVR
jgi:predicted component of type VI protein secretion system